MRNYRNNDPIEFIIVLLVIILIVGFFTGCASGSAGSMTRAERMEMRIEGCKAAGGVPEVEYSFGEVWAYRGCVR